MINLSGKVFQANALFLQPTYTCGKNCTGCYVKEQEKVFSTSEMPMKAWTEIVKEVLYTQERIQSEQVTLALDALPNIIDTEPSLQKLLIRNKMKDVAFHFFYYAKHKKNQTEAHFTVNCINDLNHYMDSYTKIYGPVLEGINLVSISNINKIEDIIKIREYVPGAKINWNILSTSIVHKDIDLVEAILKRVDMAYLLLHKAPMGHSGHNINTFLESLKYLSQLDKEVETVDNACKVPSVTSKIVTDGCMNDAKKYLTTKFGCSSNISRFQIWPDGRVTGCAYNSHNQYGQKAQSVDGVLANLQDARTRYEFKDCSIPGELQKLNDGRKHLAIV